MKVAGNGISHWLLTDFEKKIVIDSEIEIRDMFDRGDFHSTDQMAYVLLNITPLIQKIGQALVNQEIAFPNALQCTPGKKRNGRRNIASRA
ncbi:MAG: hypothetical protein V9G25_07950 [Acidimicrobiia bacterium]